MKILYNNQTGCISIRPTKKNIVSNDGNLHITYICNYDVRITKLDDITKHDIFNDFPQWMQQIYLEPGNDVKASHEILPHGDACPAVVTSKYPYLVHHIVNSKGKYTGTDLHHGVSVPGKNTYKFSITNFGFFDSIANSFTGLVTGGSSTVARGAGAASCGASNSAACQALHDS